MIMSKSLFGFLTYLEYIVDRVFIDEDYDRNRLIISKILEGGSCG